MKPLRLRLEAELEFFEATLWYETEREGLGFAFDAEIHATLIRVAERRAHTEMPGPEWIRMHVRVEARSPAWIHEIGAPEPYSGAREILGRGALL